MFEFTEVLHRLVESDQAFVLVTLVDIKGSAPQECGAKMLVTTDGLFWGTVGGGKIEAHAIGHAQNLITESSNSQLCRWNLQRDIGMTCGGEVQLFFDVNIRDTLTIAIFGAGHISQELTRVLSNWEANILVIDSRKEWLEKLPQCKTVKPIHCENPEQWVEKLPKNSFVLSMTKGHATDLPILKKALAKDDYFSMVGVIGSDQKANRIKMDLRDQSLEESLIEKMISPLGLPIGSNKPSEIAISIAAQILTVRDSLSFIVAKGQLKTK